LQEIQEKSMNY